MRFSSIFWTPGNKNLIFFIPCSSGKAKDAIFYSYTRHINGFAAVLEDEEASRISSECFGEVNVCSSFVFVF